MSEREWLEGLREEDELAAAESLPRVEQPTAQERARETLEALGGEDIRLNGCICKPGDACYLHAHLLPEALTVFDSLEARLRVAEEALRPLRKIVDAQAEDEALWALYPFGKQPIVEAYLQQELRALHAAVEAALGSVGVGDK